jgi:hypothetical protein
MASVISGGTKIRTVVRTECEDSKFVLRCLHERVKTSTHDVSQRFWSASCDYYFVFNSFLTKQICVCATTHRVERPLTHYSSSEAFCVTMLHSSRVRAGGVLPIRHHSLPPSGPRTGVDSIRHPPVDDKCRDLPKPTSQAHHSRLPCMHGGSLGPVEWSHSQTRLLRSVS